MTEQNSTRAEQDIDTTSDWLRAYEAAREGAVLFDRSAEGRLRITGKDRVSWLQGLVTNDVAVLRPGDGCEAAYLTPQGRMIADLRVLALGHEFLVDVPAATRATVRDRFEMFVISEDVTIEDVTSSLARLALHGGAAPGILATAIGSRDVPPLDEHQSTTLQTGLAGVEQLSILVAGARRFGHPGFDLYVPAHASGLLLETLQRAGAVQGDERTWDTLRVERGVPFFGVDMDENTIPLEAGLEDRAISQTKGCYVGQEVIVRVLHRGHGRIARKLVGLAPVSPGEEEGVHVVVRGATLHSTTNGREIGRITSAAVSPTLGSVIALGYLQRDFISPGTVVEARQEGHASALVVRTLPFV